MKKASIDSAPVVLLAVTLALIVSSSPTSAQGTGTVRGKVENAITREPISGMVVRLEEWSVETRTGEDGSFVLTGVPAGEVRLALERQPDFVRTVELVRVYAGEITQVSLEVMPLAVFLEELLVKGEPGGLDAVVKTYGEGEVVSLGGNATVVDLLAQGFPGVEVHRGSGQVGTSATILIRGAKSLTLPGDPLVYLDGIRVGSTSGVGWMDSGDVLGILETIPAGTVERIEILKGPAATRYGVGANNGVILIWTRRGPGGSGA